MKISANKYIHKSTLEWIEGWCNSTPNSPFGEGYKAAMQDVYEELTNYSPPDKAMKAFIKSQMDGDEIKGHRGQ